jgi:hypothetical protein
MTNPIGNEPNRPAAFDFGLGTPNTGGPGDEPPTRRSARRAAVDSRSLALPLVIVLVVIAVLGGAAFAGWYIVKTSEDEVKADSAAFCANLAETPGVLAQPGFGWPTDGADLTTTLDLMKGYQERWVAIAAVAPPTIQRDAENVAAAAGVITTGIETTKSIDRPATLATMDSVTSKTQLRAWSAKYCS